MYKIIRKCDTYGECSPLTNSPLWVEAWVNKKDFTIAEVQWFDEVDYNKDDWYTEYSNYDAAFTALNFTRINDKNTERYENILEYFKIIEC